MPAAASGLQRSTLPSRLYWSAFTLLQVPGSWRLPFAQPARLAALQDRRVREIVAHAYATVPFYRDTMGELGLRPTDFRTAADLAKLPVVRGSELARDPHRFLSTAVVGEPLLEVTTSGSTGHAKRIWWDRAAVFRARAVGVRRRQVLAELLGRWRGFRVLGIGPRGGTARETQAFQNAHSWFPSALASGRASSGAASSCERNVEAINAMKPDLVSGFGACIGPTFRWARAHGREIARPRLISYAGEQMPEADRKLLETELGIPIVTTYHACEAFRIAFQCPRRDGFHIHMDQVALRIADAQGATLPPGRRGRIVISNLTNRATVLLNYDTGDLGSLAAAPCSCGRTFPMLADLGGREDDLVVLPGGEQVHDSVLLSQLYDVPGVVRLQLVQETLDRFRIRVVHSQELAESELRERLVATLARLIGPNLRDVQVEVVEELAPAASGKFKSVISRVPRA
jgi:phenylacetate-CoA ligase